MGFGPTEIRIMFILINTSLVIFGRTYLAGFTPFILAVSFVFPVIYVYVTQKELGKSTWKIKKNRKKMAVKMNETPRSKFKDIGREKDK
jgi:hypothetical protein